jgi:hypothetical protein
MLIDLEGVHAFGMQGTTARPLRTYEAAKVRR